MCLAHNYILNAVISSRLSLDPTGNCSNGGIFGGVTYVIISAIVVWADLTCVIIP